MANCQKVPAPPQTSCSSVGGQNSMRLIALQLCTALLVGGLGAVGVVALTRVEVAQDAL